MKSNNILILGTHHLMSKEEIESSINEFNPEIIGVELCPTRLNLMVINPPQVQEVKEPIGLIDKISQAIKKKSEESGNNYGSDQLTASKYALENNIPLACLDRDILETKTLMEKIPQNEMVTFLGELAKFEQMNMNEFKNQVETQNEQEVIKKLKEQYPISYEVLITSRDLYLAFNILKLIYNNPNKKIMILIGKGHKLQIENLLKGGFN